MRVSQLTAVMEKEETICICDIRKTIDKCELYNGYVKGIKRDDPINKMHVNGVSACEGQIVVFVKDERGQT